MNRNNKGKFIKGHKINLGLKHSEEWNKNYSNARMGHLVSEETREKISESKKGSITSKETREKLSNAFKGRIFTKEWKQKISEAKKGKPLSEENKRKLSIAHLGKSPWNKDKKMSEEYCQMISKRFNGHKQSPETIAKRILSCKGKHCGEKHENWKGGITPLRKKLYFSEEYRNWRKSVFERDNYTCQICSIRGKELNADHIKPWAYYPELRFDINNGRALCIECHRNTETYGRNESNTGVVTYTY